jgi:hypothetical protein
MSVLVRFTPVSISEDQYDQSVSRLQEMGEWLPDGMQSHTCFRDGGGLAVVEVWDSPEQARTFGEKLMPMLAEIGIDPGEPEINDVYNVALR